jgi:hypothetical protein
VWQTENVETGIERPPHVSCRRVRPTTTVIAMSLPERDWRLLRSLHDVALDRYCTQVLEECAAVTRATESSAHEKYLRLFRLIKARDNSIAGAFNDLRRSTAIQRLAGMMLLGVVTDEDLAPFSQSTRESATALAEIFGPKKKRRKKG